MTLIDRSIKQSFIEAEKYKKIAGIAGTEAAIKVLAADIGSQEQLDVSVSKDPQTAGQLIAQISDIRAHVENNNLDCHIHNGSTSVQGIGATKAKALKALFDTLLDPDKAWQSGYHERGSTLAVGPSITQPRAFISVKP